MKIVFMGTPDFAVFSLQALCNAPHHEVIAVVTQPDKPKGRGYALLPPPVKVFAEEKGIPVYQPATLRDEAFANLLEELSPDLIAVVAYGKILPPNVLQFPTYGCINVHGSLLPEYRGAAPMQRAILDGKAVTGITTMYMAEGMDTGDMLLKGECSIEEADNFETIHDKLGALGADLLLRTVDGLAEGTLTRIPQEEALATYAAKITKEDCLVC
ncbi:MAG: methionyl-tRNA formyltransferase, partial [Clostridia bacterium]|nr:methionyl-tRNA formyltransferase [Clostridia bacterium]